MMLTSVDVSCPWCAETFDAQIDPSAGDQCYVEDCHVCCRPIVFDLRVDVDGQLLSVEVRREND